MSEEKSLFTPEQQAELERRIAAFNRQMSFTVVKPTEKPAVSDKETAPIATVAQPKALGW